MLTMHGSTLIRREIALLEGNVLHTYRDAVGVPTLGVGHTAAAGPPIPTPGLTITAAQSDAILAADLARTYEPAVCRRVTVPLATHEFDACLSLVFNVGEGNLAKSDLLRRLNAGDKAGAAEGFGHFTTSHGRQLDGLVKRRAVERQIFEHGVYPGLKPDAGHTGAEMSSAVTLGEGATGDAVRHLQSDLHALGFLPREPDGAFGPLTKHAVQAFQRAHGLSDDGVAGLKTGMAIEAALRPPVPVVAASGAQPHPAAALGYRPIPPAAPAHPTPPAPGPALLPWPVRWQILFTGRLPT